MRIGIPLHHDSGLAAQPVEDYPSYEAVASIDPLAVDSMIKRLPRYNQSGDIPAISGAAAFAVATATILEAPTPAQALASLRDLDVLASSLLKHGEQPLQTIGGLEEQFLRMGKAADSVPRMTVFTYAAANPTGERRRLFTGSEQEAVFIDALARGIVSLDVAVEDMSHIELGSSGQSDIEHALHQATTTLEITKSGITDVIRRVSPEFFTRHIKSYFESLVIGGQNVTAASGAQMQLTIVDQMMWGCEDSDPDYKQYFTQNHASLSPVQQRALDVFMRRNGGKSIVSWLCENPDDSSQAMQAAVGLLKMTKKFRYPHRQVAKRNFELRPSNAVGSGSYSIDMLNLLIEKTGAALQRLEDAA